MAARRRDRRLKSTTNRRSKRAPVPREQRNGLHAYSYDSDQIEKLLATGEDAERLKVYFGDARYQELRELALQAQVHERKARGGPRVLISIVVQRLPESYCTSGLATLTMAPVRPD